MRVLVPQELAVELPHARGSDESTPTKEEALECTAVLDYTFNRQVDLCFCGGRRILYQGRPTFISAPGKELAMPHESAHIK